MFFVLQNLEICTGTNAFVPVEGIHWRTGADNVGHYSRPPPSQFETAFCKTCGVCAANIYIRRKSVKTLLAARWTGSISNPIWSANKTLPKALQT